MPSPLQVGAPTRGAPRRRQPAAKPAEQTDPAGDLARLMERRKKMRVLLQLEADRSEE